MTGTRAAAFPSFVVWSVARGRVLFNRGDFWGCHEALEPAWRDADGDERAVLQGLIQAAAAFHKLVVQDNREGARRLMQRSLTRLARSSGDQFGLTMGVLRAELEDWLARLAEPGDEGTIGSLVGLPRLEWSDDAVTKRIVVDAVRLYEISLGGRRAVLVALEADGVEGWGECRSSWGTHGLWDSLVQGVAPALLTEPIAAPSEARLLWGDVTETASALSGAESALWDVWARMRGISLCEAYGHAARPVPLAARVPSADGPVVSAALAQLVGAGYQRIIVPARPNADRRVIPALTSGCPVPIAIELGGAYRMADLQALRVLDDLRPSLLMQPVPACVPAQAGRMRRNLTSPVSMGGWTTVEAIDSAFEQEACDMVHVDTARLGPTDVLCAAEMMQYLSRRLWLTSSAITEVGAIADLALAAHPAFSEPNDLSGGWNEDGGPAVVPTEDGSALPLSGEGLAYVPDPAWLESVTRKRVELRA